MEVGGGMENTGSDPGREARKQEELRLPWLYT